MSFADPESRPHSKPDAPWRERESVCVYACPCMYVCISNACVCPHLAVMASDLRAQRRRATLLRYPLLWIVSLHGHGVVMFYFTSPDAEAFLPSRLTIIMVTLSIKDVACSGLYIGWSQIHRRPLHLVGRVVCFSTAQSEHEYEGIYSQRIVLVQNSLTLIT